MCFLVARLRILDGRTGQECEQEEAEVTAISCDTTKPWGLAHNRGALGKYSVEFIFLRNSQELRGRRSVIFQWPLVSGIGRHGY